MNEYFCVLTPKFDEMEPAALRRAPAHQLKWTSRTQTPAITRTHSTAHMQMHRRPASERVRVRVDRKECECAALGGSAQWPPHSVIVQFVCVLPLTSSCLRVDGRVRVECGCRCAMALQRDPRLGGRRGPSGRLWLLQARTGPDRTGSDRIGSARLDSLRLDSKQSVTNGTRLNESSDGCVCVWCDVDHWAAAAGRHEEHAHQTKVTDTLTRPTNSKEKHSHK